MGTGRILRAYGPGGRLALGFAVGAVAVLAAGLGVAGQAAVASPAGVPRGHASPVPGVARAMPAPFAKQRPRVPASELECFYTFPECSSTDPSVMIPIANSGDSSSCVFEFTVDWGDGHSDSQTFPGSASDGTIATFTHAYDNKPANYKVVVTGQVLSNSDPSVTCTATGANLQFNLTPAVGLVGLRFAAPDAKKLGTPGLPVIKDDGPSVIMDRGWGPTPCDGVDDPTQYDYLNCASPVPQGGPPDKQWPVIFVSDTPLTISKVVFVANGKITDPELTADASVRCDSGKFSFPVLASRAMTLAKQKTGNRYELTAINLAFTGAKLPVGAGQCAAFFNWIVTEPSTGATITTQQYDILYLTAAPYEAPNTASFQADQVNQPYESLVQIGSVAAAGKSGQKAVFDAIWKKFASLDIAHPILNPMTGQVTDGPSFKYYNNRYKKIADAFHSNGGCPSFTWFLTHDAGHCGSFAAFLTGVLAFQGIGSNAIKLGNLRAVFNAGPDPEPGLGPYAYAYMLIGPGLWSFSHKNAPGRYPYRDTIKVDRSQITITGSAVTYHSAKPIAQGPVTDPPMLFTDGDHAIVNVLFKGMTVAQVVDPSYGNPKDPAPYTSLAAYEKSALAGFAVIYRAVTKNGKTTTAPIQNVDSVAAQCKPATKRGEHITCYFQATPYK